MLKRKLRPEAMFMATTAVSAKISCLDRVFVEFACSIYLLRQHYAACAHAWLPGLLIVPYGIL